MKKGKTIEVEQPTESVISWFAKNVGPRTHYTMYDIGGEGWRFYTKAVSPLERMNMRSLKLKSKWYLEVDDEKMLVFYLLQKQ